ncbi:DUF2946 domain-containing protein [Paraburkholderia sp. J94]|uniref:DUF2946 domain-containing protein n=1 Tax=Paraburkholderia sp. J94 TaxID=2805441 RepID=UPI002AB1D3EA|nr:DUF2946 domain-containing protein [Paraburkholderia sp. J94]
MFRRSIRVTAWLGILAILLAVLAPLGSQLIEREQVPTDVLCSAASHDESPGSAASHSGKQLAVHLDACGYCSLLAHSPALNTASTAIVGADPGARLSAPGHVGIDLPRVRYLHRPLRAPPFDA